MNDKIQLKRGTLANWLKADPVLADGEMALVATDASKPTVYDSQKVGDGTHKFSELEMLGYKCLQELGDSQQFPMSQKAITDWVNKGYQFRGVATPSTNPGTPDGPVFYFATKAGIYANFNSISVADGEVVILQWDNGAWTKKTTGFAAEQEIIYDVSARNGGVVFESLSALLGSADLSTLIPTSVRHGGMSIRFIQGSVSSSSNTYVQYRLMNQNWSTVITDWQDCAYIYNIPETKVGYILKNGNEDDLDTNWIKTDYVNVREGDNIYINLKDSTEQVRVISFFNSEKTLLSYELGNHLGYYTVIPSGVKYVRFCGMSSNFGQYDPDVMIFFPISELNEKKLDKDVFEDFKSESKPVVFRDNMLFDDVTGETIIAGFIDIRGAFNSDSNWLSSDFIEVNPWQIVVFKAIGHTNVSSIALYDESKALITNCVAPSDGKFFSGLLQVPANAKYYRITKRAGNSEQEFYISDSRLFDMNNLEDKVFVDNINRSLGVVLGESETYSVFDVLSTINFGQGYYWSAPDVVSSFQTFKYGTLSLQEYVGYKLFLSRTNYCWVKYKDGSSEAATGTIDVTDEMSELQISYDTAVGEITLTCNNYIFYKGGLDKNIFNLVFDYIENSSKHIGYIGQNGEIADTTDTNWKYSDFIKCQVGDIIDYIISGHNSVSSITIYNENLSVLYALSAQRAEVELRGEKAITETGAAYVRFCIRNRTTKLQKIQIHREFHFDDYIKELSITDQETNYKNEVISPYAVYDVCNNIPNNSTNGGRNRNASQAVYIDHFLTGITHEMDIHFKNAVDRIVFSAPMYVTDSSEFTPGTNFNNGRNINEENFKISIVGRNIEMKEFTVKHRSTLNSITSSAHPKVLCIGDSITYGEQATMPNDNYTSNQAYHLICKQLFMKDAIDNSGSGFDISFLGHYIKENTFVYKGTTYQCRTHHEGIRGISMSSYLDGTVTAFKSGVTNKFSIDAWLGKYRTMDDAGNRLPWVSAGATVVGQDGNTYTIGTLIDSETALNNIDVCLPSHVLIMLGMNGGATVAQYQEMIGIIHDEHPDIYVAIGIPDCAGTYFPSLHQNCGDECVIWNDNKHNQGSRHLQMYVVQKNIQEEFAKASYESDKVYMLPFFFVTPTAEGVSNRVANLPDAEFNIVKNNNYLVNYGWYSSTHMNAYGHMNWGYCLYSWLKYTIALGL